MIPEDLFECGRGREISRRGFLAALSSLPISQLTRSSFSSVLLEEGNPRVAFEGIVPFVEPTDAPLNTAINSQLDERRYTDLSRITNKQLITPENEFFIRTGASPLLPQTDNWTIRIEGTPQTNASLSVSDTFHRAREMGTHLMECSGNGSLTRFGLVSVAPWQGLPLLEVLQRFKPESFCRILIEGFDEYPLRSFTSRAGASWCFTNEQLEKAGAFLASGMYGQPLTADHGGPVRLVMPGWYGCASIKWVNRIAFVDQDLPATSQMKEFATRTLQNAIPELAREYSPATIDPVALPIRIEKWRRGSVLTYRVAGLFWGGRKSVKSLGIRFSPDENFSHVTDFRSYDDGPWQLWSHDWQPRQRGTFTIRLAVLEPLSRCRKMDAGFYDRHLVINDV